MFGTRLFGTLVDHLYEPDPGHAERNHIGCTGMGYYEPCRICRQHPVLHPDPDELAARRAILATRPDDVSVIE